MRISKRQLEATPSKEFSSRTDESVFKYRLHRYIHSTTVYFLLPPRSLPSYHHTDRPLIIASIECCLKPQLRHPLTLKHHLCKLPKNLNLPKLHPDTLAVSHHISSYFDKLLVVPTPISKVNDINDKNFHDSTLFALYDGGKLRGCLPYADEWVNLSRNRSADKFDDIAVFNGKIYVLDRMGKLYVINNDIKSRKISIGKTLITRPITPGSGWWRKRVVIDGKKLYLVVRTKEKMFEVYKLMRQGKVFNWDKIEKFDGKKVLLIARDYYFFRRVSSKFPGREFKNCIVFSEGAFPLCCIDCWVFTQIGKQNCDSEEIIAIFRLGDQTFAKEDEKADFPKINWSPPHWIFTVSHGPAAETLRFVAASRKSLNSGVGRRIQSHSSSDSHSKSKREAEEDGGGKDSNSEDEEQEGMESDSDSHDQEKEGRESDSDSQDQEQEGTESDSDSQDQEDGKMQCDSNSQDEEMHSNAIIGGDASLLEDEEMRSNANIGGEASLQEDKEMRSNANIGGGASLQEDVSPSLFAPGSETTDIATASHSVAEEQVTRTYSMNDGNVATEDETSRKNITHLQPTACTSSTTKVLNTGATKVILEQPNLKDLI